MLKSDFEKKLKAIPEAEPDDEDLELLKIAVRENKPETLAAMQEARDIISGKVQAKTFNTVEELMEDLNIDDEG